MKLLPASAVCLLAIIFVLSEARPPRLRQRELETKRAYEELIRDLKEYIETRGRGRGRGRGPQKNGKKNDPLFKSIHEHRSEGDGKYLTKEAFEKMIEDTGATKHRSDLIELFDEDDKDSDGKLNKEEFKSYAELGVFKEKDANKDKLLDEDEDAEDIAECDYNGDKHINTLEWFLCP